MPSRVKKMPINNSYIRMTAISTWLAVIFIFHQTIYLWWAFCSSSLRSVLNDRICHVTHDAMIKSNVATHHILTNIDDIIIVIHSDDTAIIFTRKGMARCIWKLVTTSLNILIDIAQSYNLREPFIKLKAANNHNGVVGNTGRNIPKKPKAKDISPNIFQKRFITLTGYKVVGELVPA